MKIKKRNGVSLTAVAVLGSVLAGSGLVASAAELPDGYTPTESVSNYKVVTFGLTIQNVEKGTGKILDTPKTLFDIELFRDALNAVGIDPDALPVLNYDPKAQAINPDDYVYIPFKVDTSGADVAVQNNQLPVKIARYGDQIAIIYGQSQTLPNGTFDNTTGILDAITASPSVMVNDEYYEYVDTVSDTYNFQVDPNKPADYTQLFYQPGTHIIKHEYNLKANTDSEPVTGDTDGGGDDPITTVSEDLTKITVNFVDDQGNKIKEPESVNKGSMTSDNMAATIEKQYYDTPITLGNGDLRQFYVVGSRDAVFSDSSPSSITLVYKAAPLEVPQASSNDEEIPFPTIYRANPDLEAGTKQTVSTGENGIQNTSVTYTYHRPTVSYVEKITTKTLKEATVEIVDVGTKPKIEETETEIITTTYTVNPDTGALIEDQVTREPKTTTTTPDVTDNNQTVQKLTTREEFLFIDQDGSEIIPSESVESVTYSYFREGADSPSTTKTGPTQEEYDSIRKTTITTADGKLYEFVNEDQPVGGSLPGGPVDLDGDGVDDDSESLTSLRIIRHYRLADVQPSTTTDSVTYTQTDYEWTFRFLNEKGEEIAPPQTISWITKVDNNNNQETIGTPVSTDGLDPRINSRIIVSTNDNGFRSFEYGFKSKEPNLEASTIEIGKPVDLDNDGDMDSRGASKLVYDLTYEFLEEIMHQPDFEPPMFVDDKGNTITSPTINNDISTPQPIQGYEYIRTEIRNGTMVHIYEAIDTVALHEDISAPAVSPASINDNVIVTRYKDTDGKVLITEVFGSEKGIKVAIPGYMYKETKESDGKFDFIYEKISQPILLPDLAVPPVPAATRDSQVVTRFVGIDEESGDPVFMTNEIIGSRPAEAISIDGYEYVRSVGEGTELIFHEYRKIDNTNNSEAPKSETPVSTSEAPKSETPVSTSEAPKSETPVSTSEAPKAETPVSTSEAPKSETPVSTSEAPKSETPVSTSEAPKSETPVSTSEAPKSETPVSTSEAPKSETFNADAFASILSPLSATSSSKNYSSTSVTNTSVGSSNNELFDNISALQAVTAETSKLVDELQARYDSLVTSSATSEVNSTVSESATSEANSTVSESATSEANSTVSESATSEANSTLSESATSEANSTVSESATSEANYTVSESATSEANSTASESATSEANSTVSESATSEANSTVFESATSEANSTVFESATSEANSTVSESATSEANSTASESATSEANSTTSESVTSEANSTTSESVTSSESATSASESNELLLNSDKTTLPSTGAKKSSLSGYGALLSALAIAALSLKQRKNRKKEQ